eukprot:TRINITY_DN1213_c0_g1_i3.p2 TRINITY_DN1213_c0_g1~~TRINITY_DN1213_c0_g1_i3.p2  ORF type:complete len:148 (-),score=19.24 TRINITY_DN1213_c0_g1_i3:208-651(-)
MSLTMSHSLAGLPSTKANAPLNKLAHPKLQRSRRSVKPVQTRADTTEKPADTLDTEKLIEDLKVKWEAVENKSNVAVYGAGAIAALWVASTLVGAVNAVPLLPKLMELVGLGYTVWFVYRYLLFKSSREELVGDVESLKKRISGDES